MKKLILIILLFTLTSCGYSPIYKDIDTKDIRIKIKDMSGDKNFNNILKLQLSEYLNREDGYEYQMSFHSTYSKTDYAKDATGKASEFELNVTINFTVEFGAKIRTFLINEKFYTNSSDDKFKQKNYEETIQKNFATAIKDQLILRLSTIQ